MSREDLLFLTGLVATPIWTFVALPLSYGDVLMVTTPKILATLAALCGGIGAWLLYKYSVSLTQFMGYSNPGLIEQVRAQNAKRLRGQRIGLGFLIVGAILGVTSAWL